MNTFTVITITCNRLDLTKQYLPMLKSKAGSDYKHIVVDNGSDDGTVEYWLYGERKDVEPSNEYDARAVENNYITITPLHIDATAGNILESLSELENII